MFQTRVVVVVPDKIMLSVNRSLDGVTSRYTETLEIRSEIG